MRKRVLFIIFSFIFCSFLYSEDGVINYWNLKNKGFFSNYDITTIRAEGIKYLNELREKAGLKKFQENLKLDYAAQNHAEYLKVNNTVNHYEVEGAPLFTGKTPLDRVFYAGYSGGIVGENISSGDSSVKESIDNLFSAIYHRFGFLNLLFDEIGIGYSYSSSSIYKSFYVYNMGNSGIKNLCEKNSYNGEGSFVYNICKDKTKKISQDLYQKTMQNYYSSAPKYILWPYNGANDVMPAFYEEIPDPLPECSVSGYPVSIQFNKEKIDKNSFRLIDFSLFDRNNKKVQNVKLLTFENDPNGEIDRYEYALMPLSRLNWNETYTAKVIYSERGEQKEITWNFHTKKLDHSYFIITEKYTEITVKPDRDYYLYFKPSGCNDLIYSFNSQFNTSSTPEIKFYDGNTLLIHIKGKIGDKVIIFTDNGKTVEITLGNKESASMLSSKEEYCGYIANSLIYLPCVMVNNRAFSLALLYKGGLYFDVTAYSLITNYNAKQCGTFDLNSGILYYPCITVDGFNFWAKFQYTGLDLTFKLIDYGK